jgi:hypothetical protein
MKYEYTYVVIIPNPTTAEVDSGAKAPGWGGKLGDPAKVKAGGGITEGRLAGGLVQAEDEKEARKIIKFMHGDVTVTSLEKRIGFQEL